MCNVSNKQKANQTKKIFGIMALANSNSYIYIYIYISISVSSLKLCCNIIPIQKGRSWNATWTTLLTFNVRNFYAYFAFLTRFSRAKCLFDHVLPTNEKFAGDFLIRRTQLGCGVGKKTRKRYKKRTLTVPASLVRVTGLGSPSYLTYAGSEHMLLIGQVSAKMRLN